MEERHGAEGDGHRDGAGAEEEVRDLRVALQSRDVIGQAKGLLMALNRISSEEAFEILRRASQRSNVKLRRVAADLVASHDRRARRDGDEPS
jgi:AmiR/NasT family two-component response regulator